MHKKIGGAFSSNVISVEEALMESPDGRSRLFVHPGKRVLPNGSLLARFCQNQQTEGWRLPELPQRVIKMEYLNMAK